MIQTLRLLTCSNLCWKWHKRVYLFYLWFIFTGQKNHWWWTMPVLPSFFAEHMVGIYNLEGRIHDTGISSHTYSITRAISISLLSIMIYYILLQTTPWGASHPHIPHQPSILQQLHHLANLQIISWTLREPPRWWWCNSPSLALRCGMPRRGWRTLDRKSVV